MVVVEVGEHEAVDVGGHKADLPQGVGDRRPRTGLTGVDQRNRVVIAPQVHLVPAQYQPVQVGTQFDDAHAEHVY